MKGLYVSQNPVYFPNPQTEITFSIAWNINI